MSNPFERIIKVVNILERVTHAPELVAQKAAPKIAAKIDEEYKLGVDPYGAAWAPLADSTRKRHGPPPLTDPSSGELQRETDAVSAGNVIIATAQQPADFHQDGSHYATHDMPARPILPNDAHGLPQSWRECIDAAKAEVEAEIQQQINAA